MFGGSSKYLAAAVEAANDRRITPDALAKKHGLDAAFLKRWVEVLAVEPPQQVEEAEDNTGGAAATA